MDKSNRIGHLDKRKTGDEEYSCYIPKPLPPDPPIQVEKFYKLLDKAHNSLGRVNGIRVNLPDPTLFFHMLSKKEAVLSSQIEGIQISLFDFLLFENNKNESKKTLSHHDHDNLEVLHYKKALDYGLEQSKKLPLSRRLICNIHAELLATERGSTKAPGQVRKLQNWIGGARPSNAVFVPPPPEALGNCLSEFEKFLNDEQVVLPELIKIAISHVQFEIIHPFLDGNGRAGRLLISLQLFLSGFLDEPLLYLSLYFKTHRARYYELLQHVRTTGDWESWIEFFLEGIDITAKQVFQTAENINALFEKDRKKIKDKNKETVGVLKTYEYLQKKPVTSIKNIVKDVDISFQTISRSLSALQKLGLVIELTGKNKNKIFVYREYLDLLSKETEINR